MAEQTFSGDIRQRSRPLDCISHLLSEKWFLRRVLSHLIDDGLHECRRVCREWNAVCKTLPVKLREVPPEHLGQVLAIFPNAVEVSCTPRFPSNDLDVVRQLAGISSLKHLDRLGYSDAQHSDDLQSICAETYTRLQSLGVYFSKTLCENFRNALLYLTELRKLDIEFGPERDIDPKSWSPFTELEGLHELSLYSDFLKNGSNQILFPSTELTKLTVDHGPFTPVSVPELLAAVGRYAGTVRSLDLRHVFVEPPLPSGMWTALQCFGQLTVLRMWIHDVWSGESLDSLFPVIGTIGTLRSLTVISRSYPTHPIGDVFCSLTNLQSLSLLFYPSGHLSASGGPAHCSVRVSQLTRLTSLALEGVPIQVSIVPLSELAHLYLANLELTLEDLSSELTQLTKLTELVWDGNRMPTLPNHVLSQLKSLQRLRLCTPNNLDLEFFQSLASLSDLTSLSFWCETQQTALDSFRIQFTVLTQLQKLELSCGRPVFDVVRLFGEGTFPRLRYLTIEYPLLEESDEQILFSRFPCLRSFKTM